MAATAGTARTTRTARTTGTVRTALRMALAVALAAGTTAAGVVTAPVAGAATSCSTAWGSGGKTAQTSSTRTTTGVRAGRHTCFDRIVVDGASWASVRYVTEVCMDGSGTRVPLRGRAYLQVLTTSGVNPDTGAHTFLPPASKRADLVDVSTFRTLRQVAWAGDFEGQLTLGVGVRAKLPFRAFVVRDPGKPPKVVVDVAHTW